MKLTTTPPTPPPSPGYMYNDNSNSCLPNMRKTMRDQWLFLGLFPFLTLFLFLVYISNLNINTPILTNKPIAIPTTHSPPEFTLLIGILCRADNYLHRHFLRLIYGIQHSPIAQVDVKFIFCNLTKAEQRILIALEILYYNDIIILNCSENMNNGKTYTYFSSLPRILSHRYDYIMKADDDTFIRLEPLVSSLRPLPRADLYYGFVIPCASQDPFVEYMSGMGFLLSWDLVEWIADSDIPAKNAVGPEDKQVGSWLKMGKKGKNRFSNKPAMYDYPGTNGRCSHDLIPETVAVHRLKRWERWAHVIRFFNVTKGLKPSMLYHIE